MPPYRRKRISAADSKAALDFGYYIHKGVHMTQQQLDTRIISPHEAMRSQWNSAGNSLPEQTAPLREFCDGWYEVVAIHGPKDLGNGEVYAVELTDDSGIMAVTYVGSKQIIDKLATPGLPEYLNNRDNLMLINFTLHMRMIGKEDRPYYTATAWFGPRDTTMKPKLSAAPLP